MSIAISRLFVTRRRPFFAAGLMSLALVMAAITSGGTEELPDTVELEITLLAPPWGAPSHYLEGPCFIKIKNKGPHPFTIPVQERAVFPIDLQEIVVPPGITKEYILILRRIKEIGPPVLFIHSGDRIL